MARSSMRSQGRLRIRPSEIDWSDAMRRLLAEHACHGSMLCHVLESVGETLGVTSTTLERRYREFLRRLELEDGAVILDPAERDAIRRAGSLLEAHRILVRQGWIVPFALFERAVWRDGGDRNLVELRTAERERRCAMRDAPACALCVDDAPAKAVAA